MGAQQRRWRDLRGELKSEGLQVIDAADVTAIERAWLADVFQSQLFPVLTPLAIDPAHPFPFIPNLAFSLVLKLKRLSDGKPLYALVPVPAQVARFWELPADATAAAAGPRAASSRWKACWCSSSTTSSPDARSRRSGVFRLIRDSDVEIEEEAEDLVREFEMRLRQRRLGSVVRIEIERLMPEELRDFIAGSLHAEPQDVILVDGMLGLDELSQLIPADRQDLKFKPVRAAFPRAHPRPRRRLLRRHPREGHPGPPPVRELRCGGAVPAPGRARSRTCWRSSRRSTAPRTTARSSRR